MKTLIVVLLIITFLQSTILPINLVLIILIARSLIRPQRANLILAFSFGLLISHLNLQPLGFQSLIFLILIQFTQILAKSKVSANPLVIVPLTLLLSSLNLTTISITAHQSIHLLPKLFWEAMFALPIFYIVRLWEERFIVRKEVKLKVG